MDTTDSLLDRLVGSGAQANRAAARHAADVLAFVQARRAQAVAAGSSAAVADEVAQVAVEEVAVALEATSWWVQRLVSTTTTLVTDLPATWAAHRDGRLDAAKAGAIASTAWVLHHHASRVRLDDEAVRHATGHTLTQLRVWLRRFVVRVEPDAATRRREAAHADRGVRITLVDDAMALLQATIPAADALLLERELTLAAKASRRDPETGDEDGRTLDQARADVLVDRLLDREDGCPGRGRFHVGITVGLESLLGLDVEPGTSVDGRLALDPALLRELLAAPGTLFSRLLTDPTGGVLDATELGRFPSPALERSLVLVDGVCAFPTCSAPAHSADTDHVTPHDAGGPTAAANLWHLCRRHHRLKTRRHLRADVTEDLRHRWTLPSGRVVDSRTHHHRARPAPAVPPPRHSRFELYFVPD